MLGLIDNRNNPEESIIVKHKAEGMIIMGYSKCLKRYHINSDLILSMARPQSTQIYKIQDSICWYKTIKYLNIVSW